MEIIGNHINNYLNETKQIIDKINQHDIYNIWKILHNLKKINGRIFVLGIGGSAANASHFVNDLRKIIKIEAYNPLDNISEFSARINDEGWNSSFIEYLRISKLNSNDVVMVLSVGGGSKKISSNIVYALRYAKDVGVKIIGIVSRDGGYTSKVADACIIIPIINNNNITLHAEEFQSIICHLLCNGDMLNEI